MAEKKKVIVQKPNIEVIKSLNFDIEAYKGGAGVRKANSLICDCEACQRLIKMVAEKKVPNLSKIIDANQAKVSRVKMSLQVDSPGFYLLPNLEKNTDGDFTHLYFHEPGKFSLVSIYKSIRDNADVFKDGMLTGRLSRKLNENQKEVFTRTFGKVFPFGIKNRTFLERKCPVWKPIEKSICDAIRNGIVNEEVEAEKDGGDIFKVFGRYIPIVWDGYKAHVFLAENEVDSRGVIPGLKANDKPERSGRYTNDMARCLAEKFEYNYPVKFMPMGYDTVHHKLVYSLEIAGVVHDWVVENSEVFKGKIHNKAMEVAKNVPNPKKFFDALNENLKRNGAPAFSATYGHPGHYIARYSKHDFKKNYGSYKNEYEYGYVVNISFKGKPEIGMDGRRSGYVTIRTNEDLSEFILIQSAWCQRVSSWSKNNLGVVDQHYNIWPIADWLSGPYAEREGLVQEEVPLVFSGNKSRTSKRDVLKNLRKKIANI